MFFFTQAAMKSFLSLHKHTSEVKVGISQQKEIVLCLLQEKNCQGKIEACYIFWRFEVLMMPTCLQYLNLVPRRKLCLVHQPRDVSSQSGANVHAKNAGFSDHVSALVQQCSAVYWWPHSWTSAGCVPSRLLQWSALTSSSKYSYPLAVHFYTGIFTTYYYRCFNDPFLNR